MSDSDYPWEVIPDPSGGYTIHFPDLPGCMTCVETLCHIGNTAAEIRDLWLATAREAGMAIPTPGSYEADYRRLRGLERAVRGMTQKLPGPLWGFVFSDEDTPGDGMVRVEVTPESDVIGRLLEGEE